MNSSSRLLAISDLHVQYRENRYFVDSLRPVSADDWLLVAGDVGDQVEDIVWALRLLANRFARVVWVPGNHELWTPKEDPFQLRGEERYRYLIHQCRDLGITTPEDPFISWESGGAAPATVVPLFIGYDGTFLSRGLPPSRMQKDAELLHADPFPTREAWCQARIEMTRNRLKTELNDRPPVVFVNHYPMVRPFLAVGDDFIARCGTVHTANWHRRYPTIAVVYGHLHAPRTHWQDGVRFEEVSLGRPAEWRARAAKPPQLREILPYSGDHADAEHG
ncbi:metallophosphoesterase family protein [Streptomyces sp. 1222.5]|uniref:metallophosphoesterase family protein n=1 Tax=Streptomyces sp. 1222.5 TaxID=1881026 RepID=UPI003D73D6ED